MEPRNSLSKRVRLAVERLEERDTPSSFTVNLGNGTVTGPDAILTMNTGVPGAYGLIDGHAAAPSGIVGQIVLGTDNRP